jgi:hypothetical protein
MENYAMKTKSVYLNGSVQQRLTRIKAIFNKMKYNPSDIGIIEASLTVYEDMLLKEGALVPSLEGE